MLRALSRADWLVQFWAWLTGTALTGKAREREALQSAPVVTAVEHLPALFTPRLDSSSPTQFAHKPKLGAVANCDRRLAARLRAVAEANVPTSRKSPGARERSVVTARAVIGVSPSVAAQQALRFAPARMTEAQHSRAAFGSNLVGSNVVALRRVQHQRPTQRRSFVGERLAA